MSEQNLTTAFTRWRSRLLRQAMRMLPSVEDAEDVLQDAFIKLWSRASQLESDEEAIALSTTVIRNLSIDRIRHGQHIQTESLNEQNGEVYDNGENEYKEDDRKALVEQIMRKTLTPLQQRIIQLREYEQRSYEEVVRLLVMKEPAVRMQLSRARKAIRDEYKRIHK